MDNPDFLKLLAEFNLFLDKISSVCSEPVNKTDEEVKAIIAQLRQSPDVGSRFYIVASTLSTDIPYHINAHKFLPLGGVFDADEYIGLIHPDYVADYLQWSIAAYYYLTEKSQKGELTVLGITFRITFPLLFKDKKYYWTLMESLPLQVDRGDNMLTHINKYTVLYPFEAETRHSLLGEFWDEHFYQPVWTREVRKAKMLHGFFILTPVERQILHLHFQNPAFTNSDIARSLAKQKNNIERHHKNIIAKAKASFPGLRPSNMKELTIFLEPYGYFDEMKGSDKKGF